MGKCNGDLMCIVITANLRHPERTVQLKIMRYITKYFTNH